MYHWKETRALKYEIPDLSGSLFGLSGRHGLCREGHAKVADVGLSQVLQNTYLSQVDGAGTFAYASPELLSGGSNCSTKADIWSFGVLLHEMVTRELPRRGKLTDITCATFPAAIPLPATYACRCLHSYVSGRSCGKAGDRDIDALIFGSATIGGVKYLPSSLAWLKGAVRKALHAATHEQSTLTKCVWCRSPEQCPGYIAALIWQCIQREPKDRPSAKAIVKVLQTATSSEEARIILAEEVDTSSYRGSLGRQPLSNFSEMCVAQRSASMPISRRMLERHSVI